MKIISLDQGNGRDLYGMMKCEHCNTSARLSGGYNDAFWHEKVLPAFHCKECGKNRAGELRSDEVTARNIAAELLERDIEIAALRDGNAHLR